MTAAAVLVAASLLSAQTQQRETEAGEGVICAWAIFAAMNEVGSRCYAGRDAEFQAAVRDGLAQLDTYVQQNSNPAPTAEQMNEFKRQQGLIGAPESTLCQGDPARLYESMAAQGAPAIRTMTDGLTARPGQPTWGTCF